MQQQIISPADRRRRDRGAVMLETALTLPVFFALIIAIMDFSIAIIMKNTMQFAVRQGVRYAITGQTIAGKGQDDSIRTVVDQNSAGFLGLTMPKGKALKDVVKITYQDPATGAELTGAGSNSGGNVVVVSATGLSWAWMAPLLRNATPLSISVSSADVMEAPPNGIPPAR